MKNYTVTYKQIENMKHCIGFNKRKVRGVKYRKYEPYRNYYTTNGDDAPLDNLVEQGLMGKQDFSGGGEKAKLYYVTDDGRRFLGDIMGIEILEEMK